VREPGRQWITWLGRFALYALPGAVGVACLIFGQTRSLHSATDVLIPTALGGVAYGFVGLVAGYYIEKRAYASAALTGILLSRRSRSSHWECCSNFLSVATSPRCLATESFTCCSRIPVTASTGIPAATHQFGHSETLGH
jgi:hypothetical protein